MKRLEIKKTYLKQWLETRIDIYKQLHPQFVSFLVMVAAAGVTGAVAIAYARLIEWATSIVVWMSIEHRWVFIAISPVLFISAWALVRFFSPEAGGSGIPQVLADIEISSTDNTYRRNPWQNLRLIAIKILSSTLAVLGGGVVGREGPTIQISAAIFSMFDGLFKRYVSPRRSQQTLLIAGGGAGLAAAFNTPLGGVVFAIEELASQHFKNFKGALILSVVIAGYVTQSILGPYLFIGHPTIGIVTLNDTAIGLAAAASIGIIGALFGKYLYVLAQKVRTATNLQRLFLAAIVGLLVSSACVFLGTDASGGGSLLIQKLLFSNIQQPNHGNIILAVWRILGLAATYLSGCAGGIFAPSLAAGASLGAVLANALNFDNQNLMIVMAMIAFLTGATRSPFTSFILVFEMTDRQAAIMPMMTAALLAYVAAKIVDQHSFYEKMRDRLLNVKLEVN
ncbi:MAG: chloride channel protein [Chitinophagaceae bacterium]|nr:chloride channel protein [Oligoflexus sp.]